jgi:hypothetical protein
VSIDISLDAQELLRTFHFDRSTADPLNSSSNINFAPVGDDGGLGGALVGVGLVVLVDGAGRGADDVEGAGLVAGAVVGGGAGLLVDGAAGGVVAAVSATRLGWLTKKVPPAGSCQAR